MNNDQDQLDEQLLERARTGDREAISTLLAKHGVVVRQRIEHDISSRWRSVLSVDDVLQQTYAEAFVSIGQLKATTAVSFIAWLTSLAKRNLIDAVRMLDAQKRGGDRQKIEPNSQASYAALLDLVSATLATPSRVVAGKEATDALSKAIAKLPEAYRVVIQQYDLEGQSIEDVAEKLGKSLGATYMLRGRAHRMLAGVMGAQSNFFSQAP